MNDISFDISFPQPTREPEAIASCFIGNDDAVDLATSPRRLTAPPMKHFQQRALIGFRLLQRLAFDTRNQRRDKPT
jgi:hypothetical protein